MFRESGLSKVKQLAICPYNVQIWTNLISRSRLLMFIHTSNRISVTYTCASRAVDIKCDSVLRDTVEANHFTSEDVSMTKAKIIKRALIVIQHVSALNTE